MTREGGDSLRPPPRLLVLMPMLMPRLLMLVLMLVLMLMLMHRIPPEKVASSPHAEGEEKKRLPLGSVWWRVSSIGL